MTNQDWNDRMEKKIGRLEETKRSLESELKTLKKMTMASSKWYTWDDERNASLAQIAIKDAVEIEVIASRA